MKHFYDFVCGSGHIHEALVEPAEIDQARACPFVDCGLRSHQVFLTSPGMHGFESKGTMMDRFTYQSHNKISRGETPDGSIAWSPVGVDDQCSCGNCSAHRKRESVTGVAGKGKDLNAYTS
jgi:hypothetical protein